MVKVTALDLTTADDDAKRRALAAGATADGRDAAGAQDLTGGSGTGRRDAGMRPLPSRKRG